MAKGILFLTLRTFSATGGIEKVCKVVCKALSDINQNDGNSKLSVLSMYDSQADIDDKYIDPLSFSGYSEKKIRFVKAAVARGRQADVVILSHINLLSVGFLIKLFSPKTRLVLFAHGIEVWGPISALRKTMLKQCDLFLTVSQFTKSRMLGLLKADEKKFVVLNNCLDPYLPAPVNRSAENELKREYGFKKDDIVLMTLTRLSSKELYKGYDHVLVSLSHLKNKYPNIKYLVVGRYDEAEKQRLDKIIQAFSLEGNVVFTGYIKDAALAAHFSLADVYVMPSKKEGFGIVFIEAMYYGLPVIAGNRDGSADALCNGKLGVLVDPDNQDEINAVIEKLILQHDQYLPDHNLLMEYFSYTCYKEKLQQILKKLMTRLIFLPLLLNSAG
jgi:glycosyltransferase involved in cell wall biosynthesis